MRRRTFIGGMSSGVLTVAALESGLLVPAALAQIRNPGTPTVLRLSQPNNPEYVAQLYKPMADPEARNLVASEVPYLFAMYDEAAKKFVNPLDIVPSKPPGAYTLSSTLHAFNIRQSDRAKFTKLRNQIQLGFNATAPVTKTDQLTWIFMNAVGIFLGKPEDREKALIKFTSDGSNGTTLQANPKVSVPKGLVSLQVTAFGQKKEGLWSKFFDVLSGALSSPIISDVSKGFGIPGLATQAVQFVDRVIDIYTEQENLLPLWQTGTLEFAIHKGAFARFKMQPGLWVTVDSDYAQRTGFLQNHTIDLQFHSFRLLDGAGQPVDANYLVTDLKFEEA